MGKDDHIIYDFFMNKEGLIFFSTFWIYSSILILLLSTKY